MRTARILIPALFFLVPAAGAAGPLTPITEWNQDRAAHLLRRAGFGGTPDEIEALAGQGLDAAVDRLIDYEKVTQTDAEFVPARGLSRLNLRARMGDLAPEERKEIRQRLVPLHRYQIEAMRAWWLRRMALTPRPLEEKMTLFWHGHFTSGAREVENTSLLWEQNAFFRKHALGKFRDLLVGVSQDGAMLKYLDNISNNKRQPNENYARELMELFTLGEGRYTETDVKEAARAFTGWTLGPEGFRVAERRHDTGVKTFLGRTGRLDGEDIIDIILEQNAASEFIARKLLRFFVIPDPPDHWVRAVAYELRRTEFDFRRTLRSLFKSEMFYDRAAVFSLIKSPVELVVGSHRLLETPLDDGQAMAQACRDMGQELFQPPSVKGWDGGRAWINTATLFERYNFGRAVLSGGDPRELKRRRRRMERLEAGMSEIADHMEDYPGLELPAEPIESRVQRPAPLLSFAERSASRDAADCAEHFARRLLQRPLSAEQREALIDVAGAEFHLSQGGAADRLREMVNVIMAMPEYQVN